MEDEINLLDYWRVILKWKKTIIVIVCAITFSSVLIALFLPKIYQAKTTIMPVGGQKVGGLAVAAAQMGLGGLLGGTTASPSPQLMALLKSRTLAERMIDKYNLKKVLYPTLWDQKNQKWILDNPKKIPTMEATVKNLFSRVSFTDDKKTQLIEIKAEIESPEVAAEIANGYVKELAAFINENTLTVAKKNRIFIEAQLERNKADLLKSGKEMSEFYAVNRISNVVPTVDVDLSMEKWDHHQPVSLDTQPSVLSTEPSPSESPEIPSTLEDDVQKKTENLQKKVGEVESQIQKAKIIKDIPQQVYLQYLTLQRELLGQVNSLLTQQYEMAKIEESKEELNFQVIDWARIPEKRFKPQRRQIVTMAFVMSIFLAIFYAFFREYLKKISSSPSP